METNPLFLIDIRIPDDHREPDASTVNGLVKSFKEIGLQTPITYYEDDEGPVLIAGRNRLEAARRLDWDTIDGIEMEVDETLREIWRIDENLMRADLTQLERTEHIARRKQLLDDKEKAKKAAASNTDKSLGSIKRGRGQPKGFDQTTADQMGVSKETVRVSRKRGEKIIPEVKEAIKGTPAANKGVELDAIADMKSEEQKEAVEQVQSGEAKDYREAKEAIKGTAKNTETLVDIEFGQLKMVWRRASVKARKKFRAWINEPGQGKAAGE